MGCSASVNQIPGLGAKIWKKTFGFLVTTIQQNHQVKILGPFTAEEMSLFFLGCFSTLLLTLYSLKQAQSQNKWEPNKHFINYIPKVLITDGGGYLFRMGESRNRETQAIHDLMKIFSGVFCA